MRRALLILAVTLTLATGCGSRVGTEQQTVKPKGYPKGTPVATVEPETAIGKMEPDERATYLGQLAEDSKFNPKEHIPMLEKYAADSDQDVAGKAKELLTRAQ